MPIKTRSQHRAGQDATRADENVTAKEGNEKQLVGEQSSGSSDVSRERKSSGSAEKPRSISDMENTISSKDQSGVIREATSVETNTTAAGASLILIQIEKSTKDTKQKALVNPTAAALQKQGIETDSEATKGIDRQGKPPPTLPSSSSTTPTGVKDEVKTDEMRRRTMQKSDDKKEVMKTGPTEQSLPPRKDLKSNSVSSGSNSGPSHCTQSDAMASYIILFIFAAFLVLIALFCYYRPIWLLPSEPAVEVPPFARFITDISLLSERFPGQNKRLWRTVKASVLHVLNETDSRYPVVILMASNTQNSQVASCVARKIASHFQSAQDLSPHEFNIADIGDFQQLDPASQKEELDKKMNNAFGYYEQKAFIIENLQLLSPEAAMMLFGYCDNDNAPFKDVMIVLMLHIDENVVKIIGPQSANAVENHLENMWSKGLDIDKGKALMSRVANNIVVIEKENDATLQGVCQ